MKYGFFLTFLIPLLSFAEMVQVPENCLYLNKIPCLSRFSTQQTLTSFSKDFNYTVGLDSILKWNQLVGGPNVDLLEGSFSVEQTADAIQPFIVNGIKVENRTFFILREKNKLKILDGEKFLLSEYQLKTSQDVESVVLKVDFLDKKTLISFLSKFFNSKKQLVQYLKKNQQLWAKEFAIQHVSQTKALKRSVASVENEAKESELSKERDAKELKKVRETFFYRTFYR